MLQVIEGVSCLWIDDQDGMEHAARELQSAEVIAVDVEGDSLGHGGRAATVQLAHSKTCYVIDLAALGMPPSLRRLLQSSQPIKVCHGFTGDQINLIEQFDLDFSEAGLLDTQEAALVIQGPGRHNGVVEILDWYTDAPKQLIEEMKEMKEKIRWVDFFQRPLPKDVARYVCLDVIFLGSAFKTMTKKLSDNGASLTEVMEKSKYRGPYARGLLYQPPTEIQRERQLQKGKEWCEETRQWVRSNGKGGGYGGTCYGGKGSGKTKGKNKGKSWM